MDFVVITDTHFKSSSNNRTGSLLEDQKAKLQWVVNYCNEHNAVLLHAGDVFDKPSVPDIVKNSLAQVLRGLNSHKFIAINGNHDRLWDNNDSIDKTSYGVWRSHGLMSDMNGMTLDLGECFLTNQVPLINRGKPQIVLFHGFLNIDDGKNSFYFQDISANITDQVYIVLGHDHVEYDPLEFQSNIKIFRPGSFTRLTRDDTSMRVPKLLHIRIRDGRMQYKLVSITAARPAEEIFKAKLTNVTKAQQRNTYEEIISQIRNASKTSMTLEEAICQVADESVQNYLFRRIKSHALDKQFNKEEL